MKGGFNMSEKVYVVRDWWHDGDIDGIYKDLKEAKRRGEEIINEYYTKYGDEDGELIDSLKQLNEDDYAEEIVAIEDYILY